MGFQWRRGVGLARRTGVAFTPTPAPNPLFKSNRGPDPVSFQHSSPSRIRTSIWVPEVSKFSHIWELEGTCMAQNGRSSLAGRFSCYKAMERP